MTHRFRGRPQVMMLMLSGAGLALALVLGQAFGSGVAAAADLPSGCDGPGRVFLVGGTWDTDGSSVVGVGQRYQGTFPPGATPPPEGAYTTEVIDYPASIWPAGSFGFDDSQAQGEKAVLSAVTSYQATCGTDKEVVIAGYSQGAGIVGDALTDIANGTTGEYLIDKTNVSGELYSDPRQSGTLWGRGVELVLVGVIPGLTMAGARTDADFGGVPVTSYCIAGDPICDLPDLLHDPIGAVDGLLGYWVKHGLYPFYMYLPPGSSWNLYGTTEPSTCTAGAANNVTTCVISSPSSTAIVTQQFIDALGLNWTAPDLMQYRFTWPDIFGITLADFQPPIAWAMGWFPQLPQLGYGGVLPSAFAFQNIVNGVFTLNPPLFIDGVSELAASGKSIALMPVNFAGHWLYRVAGVEPNPFPGPAVRPSWEAMKLWFDSLGSGATVAAPGAASAAAGPLPSTSATAVSVENGATEDVSSSSTELPGGALVPQARSVSPPGNAAGIGDGAAAATPAVPVDDAATPEVSGPDSATPEVSGPDSATPEVSGPDSATPEVSGPDSATPEVSGPDSATPEVPGEDKDAGTGSGDRVSGETTAPSDTSDGQGTASTSDRAASSGSTSSATGTSSAGNTSN